MDSIDRAIAYFGSQTEMAAALGITQPTVSEWLHGVRQVPVERCLQIEEATGGAMRCEELRPDIPWGVLRKRRARKS